MSYITQLKNVSYRFQGDDKYVLKDISLSLDKGSFNILVGPGGSGKTTLCKIFDGRIPHLIPGDLKGEILIQDRLSSDVKMKDISCCVGSVFQDPESMFATLSVEDEIAFGPENLLHKKEKILNDVENLLDLTDIKKYRKNLVWNLSGGQIQKLGLASVLAMSPRLIILDEPTANLDPAATRQVHELILKLRAEEMTILLVTRELDDFIAEADKIAVLNKGELTMEGAPYPLLLERGSEIEEMGIWLPETVEIGLGLMRAGYSLDRIPITVEETLETLHSLNLCSSGINLDGEKKKISETDAPSLIDGKNIKFKYSNGLYALKGIDLSIRKGEMLAIVGRNGAGKSTMAKLLIGLNPCKEGELLLFGKKSDKWKVPDLANHISLVFQNPEHQFLTDTVGEEIEYSLLSQGIFDKDQLSVERNRILEMLDLKEEIDSHPFALSAGNKRRLGVATMLVGDPQVLIVDEPTYGQDKEMTGTLMKLMKEIQSRGIAVVMISHDMRLVEEYADRVVVFSEGNKYFDGIPTELFDKSDILEKASLQPTLLFQILKKLEQSGVNCHGNIPGTESFLKLLLKTAEVF